MIYCFNSRESKLFFALLFHFWCYYNARSVHAWNDFINVAWIPQKSVAKYKPNNIFCVFLLFMNYSYWINTQKYGNISCTCIFRGENTKAWNIGRQISECFGSCGGLSSIFRCWGSSRDKVWEGSRSSLAGNLSGFCFDEFEEIQTFGDYSNFRSLPRFLELSMIFPTHFTPSKNTQNNTNPVILN
jgi:hypothetical protein